MRDIQLCRYSQLCGQCRSISNTGMVQCCNCCYLFRSVYFIVQQISIFCQQIYESSILLNTFHLQAFHVICNIPLMSSAVTCSSYNSHLNQQSSHHVVYIIFITHLVLLQFDCGNNLTHTSDWHILRCGWCCRSCQKSQCL